MRFTLEPEPPPPLPTEVKEDKAASPVKKSHDLDRWKEDGDEGWGEPVKSEEKGKGKEAVAERDQAEEEAARKKKALERSTWAVTSESWDDDFDFQHAPPPPPPRSHRTTSQPHSRTRSRPTTPSRHVSSSSASGYSASVPRSTPSRSSHGKPSYSPPRSPSRFFLTSGFAQNPSLDSLASSINLLSDHEPTVTVECGAPSAPRPLPSPPLPSHPFYRSDRPSPSTATVVRSVPASQQATPKSRIQRGSSRPPVPSQPVSDSPASSPQTGDDDDFRSATPSLTEDSLYSLTAFESELATDLDGDLVQGVDTAGEGSTTEDERTVVALNAREREKDELNSSAGSGSGIFSGLRSVGGGKKWRFGRSNSQRSKEKENNAVMPPSPAPPAPTQRSSGLFGRRIGPREREPEAMVAVRAELEKHASAAADAVRSRLPRPTTSPGKGEVVILGRRSRTSAGTAGAAGSGGSAGSAIPIRTREKHSSNTSISTTSTSRSNGSSSSNPPLSATASSFTRPHRSSLHFVPFSFDPTSRRGSTASPILDTQPPPTPGSTTLSWREYDGRASEDAGETTGAEMSEFSGDDGWPPSRQHVHGRGREKRSTAGRSASRGTADRGNGSIAPSQSVMSMSASDRPISPVESILLAGDEAEKSRWNASQVSFASTAEAFALRPERPEEHKSGKDKLAKRQLGSSESTGTLTASKSTPRFLGELASSSIAATPADEPKNRTDQSRARRHRHAPSMAFAQESDNEAASQRRRTVRQRSVTSPEQPEKERHRGSVFVESDDPEWLGVVPFPPSPRASCDGSRSTAPSSARGAAPRLPASTSTSSLRSPSRFLRNVSGAGDRSHPPITSRTQAEAKAAKRTSGLGASLSNILSRSTSALPLGGVGTGEGGGKRAPSPAPSAKSGRSSRSLLVKRSSKGKKSGARAAEAVGADADDEGEKLPKSPSLGILRRRSSRPGSPAFSSRRRSGNSTTTSQSSSRLPSPATSTPPPPLPHSESAFSFFRARGFSRSTPKAPPLPPSPVKSSIPRPSSDATPRPSLAQNRSSAPRPRPANRSATNTAVTNGAVPRGQLNTAFKMPTGPRPESTISNVSTTSGSTGSFASYASTIMPLSGYRDAAVAKAMRSQNGPPVTGKKGAGGGKPPQTRSAQTGHRPSVSLSSIMPLRGSSPRPPPPQHAPPPPALIPHASDSPPPHPYDRPRTALGGERPPTNYYFDEDFAISESDFSLPRRNSLSDLRIPARITSSQKKIEEDLERVKQFAKGIEELKALKRQYDKLIQVFVDPPSPEHLSPISHPFADPSSAEGPSPAALSKAASAIRRVELDYSQWWEQAQTLIDLGDGKSASTATTSGTRGRNSPGVLASQRDRCVSLAPEKTPSKLRHPPSGSETETEATFTATGGNEGFLLSVTNPNGRKPMIRQASASSIQTELSVEARQREMLRGVLAPATKGASLPSRGPPPARPGLSVITVDEGGKPGLRTASRTASADQQATPTRAIPLNHAHTFSPTSTRPKQPLPPPAHVAMPPSSRRVSRAGVFGIREFLLRLRSKATEELAASVGTLPIAPADEQPSHPSSSSSASPAHRSVSDPASRPQTPLPSSARGLGLGAPPTVPSTLSSTRRFSSSSSSDSGSDWDADLSPPRNSLIEQGQEMTGSMRARGRTISVGTAAGLAAGGGKELMILTTEAMPSLVEKVREVREKCEACIGLLKGLTV
ncbi:hypothetical protein JCM11251_003552 [Rhodosporidiobolus azoricus]